MTDIFQRFIAVPKNEEGMEMYKTCTDSCSGVDYFDISDSDFENLIAANIIEKFYKVAEVLIDDYESDYIPADKINICLDILDESTVLKNSVFSKAFEKAIESGYGLFTEF